MTTLLLAILLSVVLVITWLLFIFHPRQSTYFITTLFDAGHALLFFALALSLSLVSRRFMGRFLLANAALAVVLSCAFGAAAELLQAQVGRDSSWSDFYVDVYGSIAGAAFFLFFYLRSLWRFGYLLLSAALLIWAFKLPVILGYANSIRVDRFPVIADFDDFWLNRYLRTMQNAKYAFVPAPEGWRGNDSKVLWVRFHPAAWPGIQISEVEPNWQGYDLLTLEIFNPGTKNVNLVVRIHDRWHNNRFHDRYSKTFYIRPGYQRLAIPLQQVKSAPKGREMDMQNIRAVMFYSYKVQTEHELYFDNVRLQKTLK